MSDSGTGLLERELLSSCIAVGPCQSKLEGGDVRGALEEAAKNGLVLLLLVPGWPCVGKGHCRVGER